jgi:hypothetical protein
MGCLLRLETGWSVDHHSEASRTHVTRRVTDFDRWGACSLGQDRVSGFARVSSPMLMHRTPQLSSLPLAAHASTSSFPQSPPPPHPLLSPPSSHLTHCLPHAASNNSAVHVVFQVCLQCYRYHAACVTVGQGIGDKLRIVALSHTQQQRASSYHSGGRTASAEHAPLTLPPQSLSWSASGDIHEC